MTDQLSAERSPNSQTELPPGWSGPVQRLLDLPTISELPETVTTLISPFTGATVHIVGTAHVSRASVDEVREVIRFTDPNAVMLELCRSRVSILLAPERDHSGSPITLVQALQNSKKDGIFPALLSYLYSGVKEKLKIVPGAEFRAAFLEAKKIPGCVISLGDRPIEVTLKRTWGNLGLIEKLKLIYTLLKESRLNITEEDIESIKDTDLITAMLKELSKQYPGIARPLIYERDEYLAYSLQHLNGPVVVGVVGLGHVEGIRKCWGQQLDIKQLLEIPPQGWWTMKKILIASLSTIFGISSIVIYVIISWLFK